jgi:predicted dehydrogenase/threonine dehydrogenase-like Zn-dependent dehydrogenase
MKQLFLMVNDGSVKVIETPAPTVKDNFVLVETEYSVVSAGTERSLASFGNKNLLQKAMERPDQVKKVFDKVSTDGLVNTVESAFNRLKEPMPMGYSGVGKVIACGKGVTDISIGDRVAMVGQAYHSEINRVNKNLIARISTEDEDIRQYAFCALGGIALEGIHQAEVIPGETIGVVGLGLLGHITARILNAYGCDVIAYDVVNKTLDSTPLKAFIKSNDENARDITMSLTQSRGVDKVIITAAANSNQPMDLAAAITRDKGIICMIGVTQMNIDRRPYYERELTFKIARSYGPGRYQSDYEEKGIDLPIGYVRFTEGRNIEEFVRLINTGRTSFTDLITHVFPFNDSPSAYELITTNSNNERYIGVLLEYSTNTDKLKSRIDGRQTFKKKTHTLGKNEILNIGLIGAGNFVKNTMLPALKKTKLYNFRGLATTGGMNAAQANTSFPFEYSTNDYHELLKDDSIDLVIVSTNHNTHAKFIVEALQAGKHVYCEKPLCLTLEELDSIEKAYEESPGELFCGLNRRHSPFIQRIKRELKTDSIPAVYNYIVNAGFIPQDHWSQDEAVGGGRIIGEAIHFIDTIQALDGSPLKKLDISFAQNEAYSSKDNAIITLGFESGATGSIIYTSMGSKKYPKEQLLVFSNGKVCKLDNYLKLSSYGSIKKQRIGMKQDKGIFTEYCFIYKVLTENKKYSIQDTLICHELILNGLSK